MSLLHDVTIHTRADSTSDGASSSSSSSSYTGRKRNSASSSASTASTATTMQSSVLSPPSASEDDKPGSTQSRGPSLAPSGASYADFVRMNRPHVRRGPWAKLVHRAWRHYHYITCTSALSVMEPWEQLLTTSVFFAIVSLLAYYFIFHFPLRLQIVSERTAFYLYGTSKTVLFRGAAAVHSSSSSAAAAAASIGQGLTRLAHAHSNTSGASAGASLPVDL